MRRVIFGLAAVAACLMASEASACHKKKVACAPAPVCEPVAVAVCEPVPVKKHCFKMPKFKMPKLGCHKKAACETVAYAPCGEVAYAAPQASYAAPQASYAAPQHSATGQMLPVPGK